MPFQTGRKFKTRVKNKTGKSGRGEELSKKEVRGNQDQERRRKPIFIDYDIDLLVTKIRPGKKLLHSSH